MKKILVLLSGFVFLLSSGQEKNEFITKVILVRHGEKAISQTTNPSLSEEGKKEQKGFQNY